MTEQESKTETTGDYSLDWLVGFAKDLRERARAEGMSEEEVKAMMRELNVAVVGEGNVLAAEAQEGEPAHVSPRVLVQCKGWDDAAKADRYEIDDGEKLVDVLAPDEPERGWTVRVKMLDGNMRQTLTLSDYSGHDLEIRLKRTLQALLDIGWEVLPEQELPKP